MAWRCKEPRIDYCIDIFGRPSNNYVPSFFEIVIERLTTGDLQLRYETYIIEA